jgi:structural maintenance of chromosome 3 (chondroitin sulfate proteoglycan 6)
VLQVGEVESRQTELRNLIASIEQLEDQVKGELSMALGNHDQADKLESETRVDELKAEIATLAQKLAEQDAQGHELARVNAKIRKNEDRYLVKRQTLSTRKDEYTNAIRDLGILPEEAYTKYVDASLDKVRLIFHDQREIQS